METMPKNQQFLCSECLNNNRCGGDCQNAASVCNEFELISFAEFKTEMLCKYGNIPNLVLTCTQNERTAWTILQKYEGLPDCFDRALISRSPIEFENQYGHIE